MGRGTNLDPPKNRTRTMQASERTYRNGQGSRESSVDRTVDLSVYTDNSNASDGRLTLDDLEVTNYAVDDLDLEKRRPVSATEGAFQNLSVSLNVGQRKKLVARPRQEGRPGSARSRIPIPVGRRNHARSPSPFFRNRFLQL